MKNFDYTIIRSKRKTLAVQVKDRDITVRAPLHTSNAQIRDFLRMHRSWIESQIEKQSAKKEKLGNIKKLTGPELEDLKKSARREIPERVNFYADEMGVSYGKVTIRSQRTRWGSCSAKGNLNFNCLLMLAPPEVLDYVVVHELCHRKEMNHSQRFYFEVQKVCPDYKKRERWLKDHGAELMALLPD